MTNTSQNNSVCNITVSVEEISEDSAESQLNVSMETIISNVKFDFKHCYEYRSIIKYLCLKGLTGKEIYGGMSKTLGAVCPSYATVKNWVAAFKRGKVSVKDDDKPERPISLSTPENVDAVHDMILSDPLISIKQISETLKISFERVHHIIHADFRKMNSKMLECRSTASKSGKFALLLCPFS
ncbi:hypothetical protein Zmor_010536 [Zophobas morio]|uniref:Mos1 transposase HTH domain-containing protein n=1 Tax=Zophobas morio TaxID=2755281 RepID=A0AA38IL65_9CUCU|nr:hypothetical protein Zmor_010536 [Zophobas morio]